MQEKKTPQGSRIAAGKIPELMLKRSVLRKLHPDIAPDMRAFYGSGCGKWQGTLTDEKLIFTSVCEVPGSENEPENYVTAAANNLLADGACPRALLTSMIFPEGCTEQEIKDAIRRTASAAAGEHMEILGGHTQISDAVIRPVFSFTGIGTVCSRRRSLKPGDALLFTKWAGMGGSAAIARHKEAELKQHFPHRLVDTAIQMETLFSVRKEITLMDEDSEWSPPAVYTVSQGGVFGALREMTEHAGVGLDLDLRRIPIRQETIEICEYFDVNPYELYGGGALLIGISPEDAEGLMKRFEREGIPCRKIGEVTDGPARILHNGEEQRFLDRAPRDAWYRFSGTASEA